ncbi:MAG: diacylglycerol/polyprenol kinase family protein [Methylococcales bacterium]
MGLVLPLVYTFSDRTTAIVTAVLLAGLFLLGETLRLRYEPLNRFLLKTFSSLAKETEARQITGATYFMFGSAVTLALYDREVAILAIVFSVFGDMAATLVGSRFGRIRVTPEKTLEGGLACFAACLLVGLVMLISGFSVLFLQVLLGALAAALIEIFSSPIDDNLTIPVFTGLLMQSVY